MLVACVKRIGEFTVETRNKKLETDLVLYVLEKQFELPERFFGAKYSGYDYKVGLLLKRFIVLITKKPHSDYLPDYQWKVNGFLFCIHTTYDRIDTIEELS